MIATLNLKNFSTLKVKLSGFSKKYQKSVVKTKKKHLPTFPMRICELSFKVDIYKLSLTINQVV